MKKLTVIILSAVLMFSLTACNEQEEVVPVVAPVDVPVITTPAPPVTTAPPITEPEPDKGGDEEEPELLSDEPEIEEDPEPIEPVVTEPEPIQTTPPAPVVTTTTPAPAPVVTTTPAQVQTNIPQQGSYTFVCNCNYCNGRTVQLTRREIPTECMTSHRTGRASCLHCSFCVPVAVQPHIPLQTGWTRHYFEHSPWNINFWEDRYIDLPQGVKILDEDINPFRSILKLNSYDFLRPLFPEFNDIKDENIRVTINCVYGLHILTERQKELEAMSHEERLEDWRRATGNPNATSYPEIPVHHEATLIVVSG
jgi:hypothetical protein